MSVKLHLSFRDRIGVVADISTLIARLHLNIVSMEVIRRNDVAHVYLEAETERIQATNEEIIEILGKIPDLQEIGFVETLPQEERENRFQVVLDNINEGIVSISRSGVVTTINRVAREILRCEDQDVVGRHVHSLHLPDYTILECLNGKQFSNVKKNFITGVRRYQYFATGTPIRDVAGRIIGAVEIARDMQEIKRLASALSEPGQISFSDLIGRSPVIQEVISFAQKIAVTDSVVSIRGESGTGKELFARAVHTASRRKGPFVAVNCAALPEQLLESELFGYVGGAFTGGRREGKAGLFEEARGGTVLLDEIGEMPLASQAKILRLIQEKNLRRIGGAKEIPVDVRIITATNQNLEQLVADRLFRQDLYYRINVLPIHIPPLRERVEDIPVLAEHFLFQLASKLGKPVQAIHAQAMDKLCRHTWPGNVRELKNVIERASILCAADLIDAPSVLFGHEIRKGRSAAAGPPAPAGVRAQQPLRELLDQYEKSLILEALGHSRSIRHAAGLLGLSHTALLNKLKKHELVWKQNKPTVMCRTK